MRPNASYSRTAMRGGNSLSAHSAPSHWTNFTRCLLGPTAMSRNGTSGTSHSASGRSHGRPRSPGDGVRSRSSGAATTKLGSARGGGVAARGVGRRVRRLDPGQVVARRGIEEVNPLGVQPQRGLVAVADPTQRIELDADLGAHLFAVQIVGE